MATVSMTELARNAGHVVDQVAKSGLPAIVTRHGAPVVAVVPIDEGVLEDVVLAQAPGCFADIGAADADLAAGRTRSAADVLAELDAADDA